MGRPLTACSFPTVLLTSNPHPIPSSTHPCDKPATPPSQPPLLSAPFTSSGQGDE